MRINRRVARRVTMAHPPRSRVLPMASILVVYSTIHGQTGRIAQRIGRVLEAAGHAATVRSVGEPGVGAAIIEHAAVVVGGSIQRGRHSRALESFVGVHRQQLASRPNAFFSVSLSAAGTAKQVAQARRCVDRFEARTGWHPAAVALFAGALPYSKYNPVLRFVMRLIVRMAHGDTDTSRDYDYTDWSAVERFAAEFASRVPALSAAAD